MRVTDMAGNPIYLFVMTSDKNHEETVSFFKAHEYFGYPGEYIRFFKQEMAPAVDYSGKVFLEEKGKAITTMTLDNNSFTYLIPVIVHACETRNFRLTNEKAVKQIKARLASNKNVDEELFLRHYDFDGINCNIFEAVSPELKEFKRRLYGKAQEYWEKEKGMKPKSSENTDITSDYEKVRSEIKAGAETINDLDLTFKSNLTVKILQDVSEISAQAKIEEERENFEDPHEVWKEMQQYIKLVIKGLNPALILAGAPGVGKTYRVKQQLKAAGYREGNNLWTI
jgi:flagellar biosynthesis GTPase FlhF